MLPQAEYIERTGNRVVLNLTGGEQMRHVEPGDFVSHLRSFQGGLEGSQIRGKVSAAYTVLTPRHQVVSDYYKFLFKSAMYVQALQTTTDQLRDGQSIRYSQFALLPLPVPPLEEQRAIAEFLDRETAEIDAFIRDQEELIRLLSERQAATISKAVTKGLDSGIGMKPSGVPWVDQVPDHWSVVQIRRTGVKCSSGTSVNGYSFPASTDEIGVLKTGSVSKGFFDPTENKRIVDEEVEKATTPVIAGTLIVNRANTPDLVGRAGYVRRPEPNLYLSDKLWMLRFSEADPLFMYYWTCSAYYRDQIRMKRVGASTSMQNVSLIDYLALYVALPPFDEQERIAHYLDDEIRLVDATIADTVDAIELMRERRTALISAAVTGKIDVRERVRGA